MKILVTGAAGFIGGHCVQHFLSQGKEVFAVVRSAQQAEVWRKRGAHCYVGDLMDAPFVNHICKNIDAVVHCAGKSGVWGGYLDYYLANVQTTEHVIAAAQASVVSRLINISTPSIYFDSRDHLNIAENWLPKRFCDNYARSKYQAESRVSQAHNDQLATVSLRPRMVLGVGDKTILPQLIGRHLSGDLKRVGRGRNLVSVTSIDNLMQAIDLCLQVPDTALGTIYNIANPEPLPLWDMIDALMGYLQMPPVTGRVPTALTWGFAAGCEAWYRCLKPGQEPPVSRLRVAILSRSLTLNIDKAVQQLGYQPKDDIQQTLAAFAQRWRNQHTG